MRPAVFAFSLLALAACQPEVPPQGAGFSDYQSYRDAQLAGTVPLSAGPLPPGAVPPTGFDPARVGAAIDAAEGRTGVPPGATVPGGAGVPVTPGGAYGAVVGGSAARTTATPSSTDPFDPNRPRGDAPAGIAVQTGELQRINTGISDEQDFNAVSQRETIESDAQRIARNRAQYVVVEPTALPERTGDAGPNIVEYAISTRNQVGEQVYRRSSVRLGSYEAACRRYKSPDLAQEAFLKSGGPKRDPKGLDPDGDGFACAWDPRPFRTALQ